MQQLPTTLPYESLAEVLDPSHTALVVVDMQNDYCTSRGVVIKPAKDLSIIRASIIPQAGLIRKAVEAGALVIYVKNTTEAGHTSDSPACLYRKIQGTTGQWPADPSQLSLDYVMEGSPGQDVIVELKDLALGAPTVRKNRASAFVNTNLDLLLRSCDIETVVVTGVVTEGCMAATARDALAYDYYCIVPRDCVGGYSRDRHDAALKVLASLLDVVDSRAILAIWDEAHGAPVRHSPAQASDVRP